MDLYTPIYIPRPVEDLDLYASLRPPQFAAGYGGREAVPITAGDMPATPPAVLAVPKGAAQQLAPQRAGRDRYAASRRPKTAEELFKLEGTGVQSLATAEEAGELFQYVIDTPVTINRQKSAMLPIVNAEVAGEKLSIFDPKVHPKYPLYGLKLKNTTDLSLMQGPVTLFDGGTYAGDAKLPDLKPGEERLVAYALDLGTEVFTDSKPHPTNIVSLRIAKGTLVRQQRSVDERIYRIRNKQNKDKIVLIEQEAGTDWKLLEPEKPYERTEKVVRFKVDLPADGTASQTVRMERVYAQTVALKDVGFDTIEQYLTSLGGEVLSPQVRQALEKVVALRSELGRTTQLREAGEKLLKETAEEQERNLQVLHSDTDSYSRQLDKLDQLETQIENLREKLAGLREQERRQQQELDEYMKNLTVDAE